MAALLASLSEFREAGMDRLREKSLALTAFLERGIHSVAAATGTQLDILTPSDPAQRAVNSASWPTVKARPSSTTSLRTA